MKSWFFECRTERWLFQVSRNFQFHLHFSAVAKTEKERIKRTVEVRRYAPPPASNACFSLDYKYSVIKRLGYENSANLTQVPTNKSIDLTMSAGSQPIPTAL